VKTLVFLVEGKSEKMLLGNLMDRLFDSDKDKVETEFIKFDGKTNLKKRSLHRIRNWCRPNSIFIVLVDQNGEDCKKLKSDLLKIYRKIEPPLIRIACHELESWYLGDLSAVEEAFGKSMKNYRNKQLYRNPDKIPKPSEILSEITNEGYRKVSGSRKIAPYLTLEGNRSPSFNAFISGVRKLVGKP